MTHPLKYYVDKLSNGDMKTGAIVLATEQGLGYLARDFYRNGLIDYVYIHEHSTRTNHREWYPRESTCRTIDELLEKSDIIFGIETFFDWKVIPQARAKGKKTVLMPMYECTPYPLPYEPDVIITPSDLDQQYYPNGIRINVPVSAEGRIRHVARTFVHNAGNGGLGGRNGTKELLEAIPLVKSPIKLIVRSQVTLDRLPKSVTQPIEEDDRVEVRIGSFDDIWSEGDVFVFPEKFNGLSLPIQEAYASGMPVMCGYRFPFNTWLPKELLIPVDRYKTERLAVEFQSAQLSPEAIAKHIDYWFNKDIREYSESGIRWGEENSWKNLSVHYKNIFS